MADKRILVSKLNTQSKKIKEETDFISTEEWNEHEENYLNRLNDLQHCKVLIDEALFESRTVHSNEEKDEWEKNFNREGLPYDYYPNEIRMFIERVRHSENEFVDKTIDWTLSIDERSILTQDRSVKDLTRKTVQKEMCPNIGSHYDETISKYITLLNNIRGILKSDSFIRNKGLRFMKNIITLKYELESEIIDTFDRHTYRVLSSMDNYMTTKDNLDYCYKAKDFDMHIWALRDIPINFHRMELPFMVASMPCVGVNVQIPISCLSQNMALRCVHTFFDCLTSNAKTYDQDFIPEENEIIAGIKAFSFLLTDDFQDSLPQKYHFILLYCVSSHTVSVIAHLKLFSSEQIPTPDINRETILIIDLQAALLVELSMQMEIMENITKQIQIDREAYERYSLKHNTERRNSKTSIKQFRSKKNKKSKKMDESKKPPRIPPNMVPNPQDIFLNREQTSFENFLRKKYHPDELKLTPDEINLKEFIMLGGTYNLFYIHVPKRKEFGSFNITNHDNYRKLIILKDIVADSGVTVTKSQFKRNTYAWMYKRKKNKLSISNETLSTAEDKLSHFVVTFQLPKHLCLWGIPIACQYEESNDEIKTVPILQEESIKHYNSEDAMSCSHWSTDNGLLRKRSEKNVESKTRSGRSSRRFTDSSLRNRNAGSLDKALSLSRKRSKLFTKSDSFMSYIKSFSTKQLSNIYRPRISSLLRHLRLPEKPPIEEKILNFKLADSCELQNSRNLVRFCMPHLLPSFKFPVDISEVQYETIERKPTFVNPLLRSILSEEAEPREALINNNINFEYVNQDNAELVFPVFSNSNINQNRLENPIPYHPCTLQNLLDKLESIERNYKESSEVLANQTPFNLQNEKRKTELKISKKFLRSPSKEHMHSDKSLIDMISSDVSSYGSFYSTESSRDTFSTKSSAKYSIMSHMPKNDDKSEFQKETHWTKKHIFMSTFDPENHTLTVQTDRLGIFGFAYKRYSHFPFKFWSLDPNAIEQNETIFTLDTQFVRVTLTISNAGYTGYVTDLLETYVPKPFKYLTIDKPIPNIKELKKLFIMNNINIFPEQDARFYIENEYLSEKHFATEYHVYKAMALHCLLLKFYHSTWNRLVSRRNIVLCLLNKDREENTGFTVRVTPEGATFVDVKEVCSDNLDEINIEFINTWRNMDDYTDLHMLIISLYSHANDLRNLDGKHINYILELLGEIRPLSFS